MQTDASSITYLIPFFVSVISWVKMLHHKKKMSYITQDQKYIEKKIENLEVTINKNKSSIFEINNQIDYIYESLINIQNNIKHTTLRFEFMTKTKSDIEVSLSQFEILINEKLYELEQRIKLIENKSMNIKEKDNLKIINPDFLIKDDMYCNYKQCKSPYNMIYTSSSTNVSSTLSPSRNNEWVSLP